MLVFQYVSFVLSKDLQCDSCNAMEKEKWMLHIDLFFAKISTHVTGRCKIFLRPPHGVAVFLYALN